jgi:hypothetical protein
MAATTTLLGLLTPTQGTLSGTWGDSVNYGISDYVDIAIAGTLLFNGDGPITLVNTTGSASGNNIGATTAQYMVIRVTGTLTTPKIITGPSYSKLYMVDNSATGSTVSFIRAGQTPAVSIAVGEKAFVYYNGTDYVKVASSVVATGTVTSVGGTGTVNGISLSGTVTTSGSLTLGGSLSGVSLTTQVTGTLPAGNGGTGITSLGAGVATFLGTPSSANLATALTDETGTGVAVFGTNPTLTGVTLAGEAACADNLVTRATLKDYAIEGSAIGSTGATRTFDLAVANFFSATLDQACTFTFSNPPASGDFGCFVLELTNGGAFVITYPASVDFIGGVAPTLTAAGVDQLVFTTRDGGTTYFCFVAGLDIKSP